MPIKKLKIDESKITAMNESQIRRLFSQIDHSTFAGYRDYCTMLTMLKCGLGINEINELEINDIDFENGLIMLPGTKNTGERLDEDAIRKRMYSYGVKAGLKGECKFSPHCLRHTFATRYLINGGDIRTLMIILRHSDISTTQIYLNYSSEDIKEKYRVVDERDELDI
ncbi:tyrosine-type recombinase/integrase [Bacillus thuringiensis]|uniref:tyrosine-type recombinase/integrase n=1 Tax=Bacillus thuringiensis TaxID=1428 RepID=UPI002413E99A|nr:site-specific integrase [Bacillus thuringiensis]